MILLKPKHGEKAKLCCFILYIKTDDIYKDTAEDVQTRFDTMNLWIMILTLIIN